MNKIIVNYGAGTNSTALLVGLQERGVRPDAIVFADTGGEKPHTYEYIKTVNKWLKQKGMPKIEIVRWIRVRAPYTGRFLSLEEVSLSRKELPSIAYGFKGCSIKWKAQPVDKWVKENFGVSGVDRLLGIDADEAHRAKTSEKWNFVYPLIDWDWGRDECISAIKRSGLPQPGKSACFFCPNSKPAEVLELREKYPDLYRRALAMEANAVPKKGSSIKGLGRRKRWADIESKDEPGGSDAPCGCYDG